MKKPELLAPIQDFTSLQAALQAGANAVYFGVRGFNMRAGARNFEIKDLKKIVQLCHKNKVKAYLALNIIIYEDEIKKVVKLLKAAKLAGVDAVICWDMSVVAEAHRLGLEIHLSTQASVANSAAATFYQQQGVKRIILARECSWQDIKKINQKLKIELEVFIHGAMCVSISGRCFLSQFMYNKSANRGECLQPCRRKYLIKQLDGENELELGEDYILSPKDLCVLPFIEKILELNLASLKIEGRNRSPEYVKTVVGVYRQAIDYYFSHLARKTLRSKINLRQKKLELEARQEFKKLKVNLMAELATVYNRGFSNGFYLGQPVNAWTHSYGSQATSKKVHVGRVTHYYSKLGVAEVEIQAKQNLRLKDSLIIEGPVTGVYEQLITSMQMRHQPIKIARQNDRVAIKLDKVVKINDKVYKKQLLK